MNTLDKRIDRRLAGIYPKDIAYMETQETGIKVTRDEVIRSLRGKVELGGLKKPYKTERTPKNYKDYLAIERKKHGI